MSSEETAIRKYLNYKSEMLRAAAEKRDMNWKHLWLNNLITGEEGERGFQSFYPDLLAALKLWLS